jgi:GH25 family lysozyme M1 (1,4-beta-N-acetylmuramidase)
MWEAIAPYPAMKEAGMSSVRRGVAVLLSTACVMTSDQRALGPAEQGRRVCPAGAVIEGIEVTGRVGAVDWRAVRHEGRKWFAYARIADGNEPDAAFAANWAAMFEAGLLRGGSIVFRADDDPEEQAALVRLAVGELAVGDLPVAVVVTEEAPARRDEVNRKLRQLLRLIHADTRRMPILRGDRAAWLVLEGADFRQYPMWHVEYADDECPIAVPPEWDSWTLWSRLGPPAARRPSGTCPGVDGYVDLVSYNGSRERVESLALMNDSCLTECAAQGCLCVDGVCSGGRCAGSGCTLPVSELCRLNGQECADGMCSGGTGKVGNGCTLRETSDCLARGAMCVDHQCSGGQLPGTGCTWAMAVGCALWGNSCVDNQCAGGLGAGSGCTAFEEGLCADERASCVDHRCEGGWFPGSGCTLAETNRCRDAGCSCVDHACSGGACPGTGCTSFEEWRCGERGLACAAHACVGG